MKDKILENNEASTPEQKGEEDNQLLVNNIKYIIDSTRIITESLQQGFHVTQYPDGDITVTEVQTVDVLYRWDPNKQKMIRVSRS